MTPTVAIMLAQFLIILILGWAAMDSRPEARAAETPIVRFVGGSGDGFHIEDRSAFSPEGASIADDTMPVGPGLASTTDHVVRARCVDITDEALDKLRGVRR